MTFPAHRFSVAPMMDWTDRHCRAFHRCLSKNALLYSEMLTADAIIHGDRDRLLGFDESEHPVALQLGGNDPEKLATASKIGAEFGYDEINLNCGCPSDRVQSGAFGACLMREPELVRDCLAAMREVVDVPVTVKSRIGVDDDDPRDRLFGFVETVREAGITHFIVHARKAWLKGLSPKENRDIPPLDYELVAELKSANPDLEIVLNGGINSLDACEEHLRVFDGVMVGREAYQKPALLAEVDNRLFGDEASVDPLRAVAAYRPYIESQLAAGTPLHAMTRHVVGLFASQPGARAWRRHLSEHGPKKGAGIEVLNDAISHVATAGLQAAE